MEAEILVVALRLQAMDGLADDLGRHFDFAEALHQGSDADIVDSFRGQFQFQRDPLTERDDAVCEGVELRITALQVFRQHFDHADISFVQLDRLGRSLVAQRAHQERRHAEDRAPHSYGQADGQRRRKAREVVELQHADDRRSRNAEDRQDSRGITTKEEGRQDNRQEKQVERHQPIAVGLVNQAGQGHCQNNEDDFEDSLVALGQIEHAWLLNENVFVAGDRDNPRRSMIAYGSSQHGFRLIELCLRGKSKSAADDRSRAIARIVGEKGRAVLPRRR